MKKILSFQIEFFRKMFPNFLKKQMEEKWAENSGRNKEVMKKYCLERKKKIKK